MRSRLAAVALTLALIGGALLIGRKEKMAIYTDDVLSFQYPASWELTVQAHPKRPDRGIWVEPKGSGLGDISFTVVERPLTGEPSPRERLLQSYAGTNMLSTSSFALSRAPITERTLPGGISALQLDDAYSLPGPDIGLEAFKETPSRPYRLIVFDHGGKRYEIDYTLPSGRLQRRQKERLFERMLASLVFKR